MNSFCPMDCGGPMADPGAVPFSRNIPQASQKNQNFRAVLWTGNRLQLTVMCIPLRGEIGWELHPDTDQLIRVEEGQASVRMGKSRDQTLFQQCLSAGDAVLVPCGTWHNVINTGKQALKLSSVYAPPQHSRGTIHRTRQDAEHEEK